MNQKLNVHYYVNLNRWCWFYTSTYMYLSYQRNWAFAMFWLYQKQFSITNVSQGCTRVVPERPLTTYYCNKVPQELSLWMVTLKDFMHRVKFKTTLYNIIKSTTGKYCPYNTCGFIWMVILQDFMHRLKFKVAWLIIHWHCFQVSYVHVQL